MIDDQDETALTEITQRLTLKFPTREPRTVWRAVDQAYRGFRDSPIRDFVPLLVERAARAQLSAR